MFLKNIKLICWELNYWDTTYLIKSNGLLIFKWEGKNIEKKKHKLFAWSLVFALDCNLDYFFKKRLKNDPYFLEVTKWSLIH